MNPARWEQVKQIVGDALEVARDQRSRFLEQACAGDAELRGEVETLLRADEPDTAFLDLDRTPERIGPYRIVREVGRGGMGAVYLGERADGQFEHSAAIKVIKRGMDTDSVLRRFFAERQILARLQHPNITRLFDGGMFDGRPYFVMEYLEGEPIVEYCRRRDLAVEDRIRLFLPVCDAVEYAHRNLILHRDLKTSNILVDSSGAPKLLDFGIAKLLEPGAAGETTAAWRPLTPQAASPEQFRGEPLTTATDVYSLGVLLFELLAGKPPYQLSGMSAPEMTRAVCERPAIRPSAAAAGPTAKKLRGDLDTIVLRALEKDPALRYQRAAELADDLRRTLEGRPILARPADTAYRVRKFVARHRRGLGIAAVAFLAVSAAATDAIVEGRRANRRFQELRQLAGSFLFEFHDAIAALPGATPARELVVQRGLQYLDSLARESSGDVGLKRELAQGYLRIGSAQGLYFDSNLGKKTAARASFEKAVALLEEVVRRRPQDAGARADLANALLGLSTTYQGENRSAQSLVYEQRVIVMLEAAAKRGPLSDAEKLALGHAYNGLAETYLAQDKDAEAVEARLHSIDILKGLVAAAPNDEVARSLAQSEKRLAYIYIVRLRDFAKAAEPLRAAMTIDEDIRRRNPESATATLDLARDRSYFASLLERRGDREGARRMMGEAIAMRSGVLAVDPRNTMLRISLVSDYSKMAGLLEGAPAREAARKGLELAQPLDSKTQVSAEMAHLRKVAGQ